MWTFMDNNNGATSRFHKVGWRNRELVFRCCTNTPLNYQILLQECYSINLNCYEKQFYYEDHNSTDSRTIAAV